MFSFRFGAFAGWFIHMVGLIIILKFLQYFDRGWGRRQTKLRTVHE